MNEPNPIVHAPVRTHLRVDVARQMLDVVRDGEVRKSYPISTSRYGLGTEPGSLKTPLGSFRICEKIGHDAPLGTVFKSRKPTGAIAPPGGDEDLILTRIFWLEGRELQNANTRDRYIYIHGTNQEDLIGTPASHGCVRMRNADIAELFREIPEGTSVNIVA